MIVRAVQAADHCDLRAVVAAAFGRSDEADMTEAVRASGHALCEFAAEDDDAVIGHILFSRMTCEPAGLVAGLAPLSVAPSHQHRGVGSALVERGFQACKDMGARGCVVLGSSAYYGRFGFSRAPATISCRYSPLEAFQAIAFKDGAFAAPIALAYPPAFG